MTAKSILLVLILVSLTAATSALSYEAGEIESELELARLDVKDMIDAGLKTTKFSEKLFDAEEKYVYELEIEKSGMETNYGQIYEIIEELYQIKESAFSAKEEIEILEQKLLSVNVFNNEPINEKLKDAKQALLLGRFRESLELVNETYELIEQSKSVDKKIISKFGLSFLIIIFVLAVFIAIAFFHLYSHQKK